MCENLTPYNGRSDDEIDLRDVFEILLRNRRLVLSFLVLSFLISLGIGQIHYKKSLKTQTIISYNFKGIEKGKNPDGSLFNANQIRSNAVLRKAYNSFPILEKNNITQNELEQAIEIEGIVPKRVTSQVEAAIKKGQEYNYYPTYYLISFRLTEDMELDKKILIKIIDEYIDYFGTLYNLQGYFGKIKVSEIMKYDYLDSIQVLEGNIEKLRRIIDKKMKSDFFSLKDNMSFQDALVHLNNIREIDLKNIAVSVNVYNLTLNKEELLAEYLDKIEKLEVLKKSKADESSIIKGMLDDYRPEKSNIIISSLDEEAISFQGSENYYSKLIEAYMKTSTEAKNIENKINHAYLKIKAIEDAEKTNDDKVEKRIISTTQKLNTLIDQINSISREYYKKEFSDGIKVIAPASTISDSKFKIIILIGLLIGVFIGILVTFIKEFIISFKQ